MLTFEMQAQIRQEQWQDMIREAAEERRVMELMQSQEDTSNAPRRWRWPRLAWPQFVRARTL